MSSILAAVSRGHRTAPRGFSPLAGLIGTVHRGHPHRLVEVFQDDGLVACAAVADANDDVALLAQQSVEQRADDVFVGKRHVRGQPLLSG